MSNKTLPLCHLLAILDWTGEERDFYTDYTDDLAVAYVGDGETSRTPAAQEHFAPIWNLPVRSAWQDRQARIHARRYEALIHEPKERTTR